MVIMMKLKKLLVVGCLLFLLTGCKNLFTYENVHPDYLEGTHYVEMKIKNYQELIYNRQYLPS